MRKSVASISIFAVCLMHTTAARADSVAPRIRVIHAKPDLVRYISDSEIAFDEYNAMDPPRVMVAGSGDEKITCRLDGVVCDPKQPVILRLKPGEHSGFLRSLEIGSDGKNTIYHFQLVDPKIGYEFIGESRLPNNLHFTAFGALLMMSPKGELLYFHREKLDGDDFKPLTIGGKTYYSYLATEWHVPGVTTIGTRVLMDAGFNVIRKFPWPSDLHEFLAFGPDHFLHTEYHARDVKGYGCLLDESVIETRGKRSKVIFSTVRDLVLGHYLPEFTYRLEFEGKSCLAFLHLNSVQIVSSEKWLIGLGYHVILFNPRAGKIIWSFGGTRDDFQTRSYKEFDLDWMLFHTPQWDGRDTLTLFSNFSPPDKTGLKHSSIYEIKLRFNPPGIISVHEDAIEDFQALHSGGFEMTGNIVTVATGQMERGQYSIYEYEKGKKSSHMKIHFTSKESTYIYRVYR